MDTALKYSLYSLAAIGALYLTSRTLSLLSILVAPLITGSKLNKYRKQGSYAIVTGASDGIGKEFAIELANKGFNLVVLARTKSKLDSLASEVMQKNKECKVVVHPFDFAKATEQDWNSLQDVILQLPCTVLVNNVGMNHSIPTPFLEEDESLVNDIVHVNISATMRITRVVLKNMQGKGLVLNVGSLSGQVPSAYLSVYAASKAFLKSWSIALAKEVAGKGIHVEHLNTYFVTTAMSKIRKPSFTTPTPKVYVKSVLKTCGNKIHSIPYPSHALLGWLLEFASDMLLINQSASMHIAIRKRALKKREREANAKKEE